MKNFGVSTPVAGAGVALALGLMLGTAMRPQLAIGELAPQALDAWPREASPTDGGSPDALAFAQYGGQLPDYVLGLDWVKATTPPAEPPPAAESSAPAAEPDYGDQPAAPAAETAPDASTHGAPAAARAAEQAPESAPRSAPRDQALSGDAGAPSAIPTLPLDDAGPLPEATGDTSLAH